MHHHGFRRSTLFLTAAALALLATASAGGTGAGAKSEHAAATGTGGFSPLLLYMNTVFVGAVHSVSGCTSFADVVLVGDGDQGLDSTMLHEPCVIEHGLMSATFESFIRKQLQGTGPGKINLQLALADPNTLAIVAEVQIIKAVLTRFVVPSLDASSADTAYFTSTFGGESIRPLTTFNVSYVKPATKPAPLTANAFTFSLGGVTQTGVRKVSSVVFRRDGELTPGPWSYADMTVSTQFGKKAGQFPSWYNKSVLQGPTTNEMAGQLHLLNSTFTTSLLTVDLPAVGVFHADNGLDPTGRGWSMYVDSAAITFG
jgi:hypothetical protein